MRKVICTICLMLISGCAPFISKSYTEIIAESDKKERKYREEHNIKLYQERYQHKLTLEMTEKEVYEKWGQPSSISKYTTTLGLFTTWGYGEMPYGRFGSRHLPDTSLHFFNHRLESIFEW